MTKYPKIETLYKRDKKTFKITNAIRCPEFENIKNWLITEKIDGTNIRVIYEFIDSDGLEFRGRTDKAQIPIFLLKELKKIFYIEKFRKIFTDTGKVCLYGEGYGARIQKGGGNYREGISFRLIDVWIDDWWLKWDDIQEIAEVLNIKTVPSFGIMTMEEAVRCICPGSFVLKSILAKEENNKLDIEAEGIVATASPLVLFRNKNPLKWKLKKKDFKEQNSPSGIKNKPTLRAKQGGKTN